MTSGAVRGNDLATPRPLPAFRLAPPGLRLALATRALRVATATTSEANCATILGMPLCKECQDDVVKLVSVRVSGKVRKLCPDCADRAREAAEVAEASEGVIQGMMGYKGRR